MCGLAGEIRFDGHEHTTAMDWLGIGAQRRIALGLRVLAGDDQDDEGTADVVAADRG